MHTDRMPKAEAKKAEFLRSEALHTLQLPDSEPVRSLALELKESLAADDRKAVQAASSEIISVLSNSYKVATPAVKILAARPQKVSGDWVFETFGDYEPDSMRIRLWMRTAVQKKPTAFGTMLHTLCHEFCHHLDMVSLDLHNTYHTRGFFERTALLYHHLQGTPVKPIVWRKLSDGTYQVDWQKMRHSARR